MILEHQRIDVKEMALQIMGAGLRLTILLYLDTAIFMRFSKVFYRISFSLVKEFHLQLSLLPFSFLLLCLMSSFQIVLSCQLRCILGLPHP